MSKALHHVRRPATALKLSVLAALAAGAAGCQTARMAVPDGLLTGTEVFSVQGRNTIEFREGFAFGPYEVTQVRRGWTSRTAWGFLSYSQSRARQSIEFAVTGPGGTWRGQAATNVRQSDLKGEAWGGTLKIGLGSELRYVARLAPEGSAKTWTLALGQGSPNAPVKGQLTDGTVFFEVVATHGLAGSPMPLGDPSGYLFLRHGQPVAAVEVINEGSVRVAQGLPPADRAPLPAAAGALLLYRDISQP